MQNPLVPVFIGPDQCRYGYHLPDALVVNRRLVCRQAIDNISYAFPVAQLTEHHTHKLISAGKILDFIIALVPINTFVKFMTGYKRRKLRKHVLACVHLR